MVFDIFIDYTGVIVYVTLLFIAVTMYFYITYQTKVYGIENVTTKSFRQIYFGLIITLITYSLPWLVRLNEENVYNQKISYFGIAVGFAIAIFGLNRFVLSIMSYPAKNKRRIQIAFISGNVLLILQAILLLPAIFIENSDYFALVVINNASAIAILALLVALFFLGIESAKATNKMFKLRLVMTAIATLGIVLDATLNILNLIFPKLNVRYYTDFTIPVLSFLFMLISLFGYYIAVFPPVWIQRVTKVLPPSYKQLMEKRKLLEKRISDGK